ncbi:MAG: hypothetical protein WBZ36_20250 [Candidatus Nitrosopolaris sp.]
MPDGFELELRNSVEKYLKNKVANELIKISFPAVHKIENVSGIETYSNRYFCAFAAHLH